MQHHPIGSFDWKRIIKRAELPRTTKLIAGFLGDFAKADGSDVRPGIKLLAKMAGVTDRTVITHMKVLRETGLIEKTKHSRMSEHADVYQLTVPGADHAPVPMRLDPDGHRIETGVPATAAGASKPAEAVENPVDNSSEGLLSDGSYVKPDAAVGETGRRFTGSQLHTSIQNNHEQPILGLLQATASLGASAGTDHGEAVAGSRFEPDEAEYAAAHQILMSLPDTEPDVTVALAELAAAGIPDPSTRQLVVRAADVATRPSVPDEPRGRNAGAGFRPGSAKGGA
jgi:hypothetical protein